MITHGYDFEAEIQVKEGVWMIGLRHPPLNLSLNLSLPLMARRQHSRGGLQKQDG